MFYIMNHVYIKRYQYLNQKIETDLKNIIPCSDIIAEYLLEEEILIYILYQNDIATSVCLFFKMGDYEFECKAFTKDSLQNQGFFRTLWNYIRKDIFSIYNEEYEDIPVLNISFPIEKCDKKLHYIFKKINAKHSETELIMRLKMSTKYILDYISSVPISLQIVQQSLDSSAYDVFLSSGEYLAIFHTLPYGIASSYFWGFSIHSNYRGRGYGKLVFAHILSYLFSQGILQIDLQIRKSNLPAIHIYQHFGFMELERVEYYNIEL